MRNAATADRRLRIGAIALIVIAAMPSPALSAESVEDLIARGVELRRQRQHERALELFERAHALEPSPRTLAQMGLAKQSLGRWIDSDAHLSTALESVDFPWIRTNRQHLENALAAVRRNLGSILVRGTPGATVSINGQTRGVLPLRGPVRVPEGRTSVQLAAPGYQPFVATIQVVPGEVATVEANLQPVVLVPAALENQPRVETAPARPDPTPETGWPPRKILATTLIGTSVAGIAGGIAFLVLDGSGSCAAQQGFQCNSNRDTKVLGWSLLGVGVASGVVGAILLFQPSRTQISFGISPEGVAARGRF